MKFFIFALIGVSIEIFVSCSNGGIYNSTCTTESCVQYANMLLSQMDLTIEPCVDFYKFACGNMPEDVIGYFQNLTLAYDYRKLVKMDEPIERNDPGITKKIKQLYQNCMSLGTTLFPAVHFIREKLFGWPAVEGSGWNPENKFSFENYFEIYYRNKLVPNDFFVLTPIIDTDIHNVDPSVYLFYVKTKFDPEYTLVVLDDRIKKTVYHNLFKILINSSDGFLHQVLISFGLNDFRKRMKIISDYFSFTTRLICLQNKQNADDWVTIPLRSVWFKDKNDMKHDASDLPWKDLITSIMKPYIIYETSTTEPYVLDIHKAFLKIDCTKCLYEIYKLVRDSPANEVVDYLTLRLIIKASPFLSKHLKKKLNDLQTNFIQTVQFSECHDIIRRCFPDYATFDYLMRHKLLNVRKSAVQLIQSVRNITKETIKSINWYEDSVRLHASKKIESVVFHIGYELVFQLDNYLRFFYCPLIPINASDPDQLWHAVRLLTYSRHELYLHNFLDQKQYSKYYWHSFSTLGSGLWYDYSYNDVYYPISLLQSYNFQQDRPMYLNYATVGSSAAKQMFYGLISKGLEISYDLKGVNWMTGKSRDEYLRRYNCFDSQMMELWKYPKSTYQEKIIALDSMISEKEGTVAAYRAYEKDILFNRIEEQALPYGFNKYTPRQMFWIAFGTMRCTGKNHIKDNKLRMLGTITNNKEFFQDFRCWSTTLMNPYEKCNMYMD